MLGVEARLLEAFLLDRLGHHRAGVEAQGRVLVAREQAHRLNGLAHAVLVQVGGVGLHVVEDVVVLLGDHRGVVEVEEAELVAVNLEAGIIFKECDLRVFIDEATSGVEGRWAGHESDALVTNDLVSSTADGEGLIREDVRSLAGIPNWMRVREMV